ncbi:CBS domain-containing protein [Candidatus Woesearchaeota archaeon]|nr:CBS domain-containing protein [Candidatus Woesearchaeota archaeon]
MSYTIQEIKELRKRNSLTQNQLAKRAGVSQSLIAKIESGRIDPTYSKVQKIFEALSSLENKNEVNITEVMNKKIIPSLLKEDVHSVIKKMQKHGISQMPVLDGDKPVGLVTDTNLLKKIAEVDDPSKLSSIHIKDVMEDCPPIVTKNASLKVVQSLLLHYPVVLVTEAGELIGLITKADILGKVYK